MSNKKQKNDIDDVSALEQEEELNSTKKLQIYAVLFFGALLLVFMLFTFFKKEKKAPEAVKKQETQAKIETKSFTTFKNMIEENQQKPETKPIKQIQNPFTAETKSSNYKKPRVYKNSSSMMISSSSNSAGQDPAGQPPVDFTDPNYSYSVENGKIKKTKKSGFNSFENEDQGIFSPKIAKVIKFNPNLLLAKGTYIGCSLNTRLISSIKGAISCTVSENVYSQNGATLLIEKGSKMLGYFTSKGNLQNGVNRIYVIWNEVRTPNHISIPLLSSATDPLGSSGIPGWVDNHWAERFGGAILLSIIDDAFNFALNKGSRGSSNKNYTENTGETTKEMAAIALEEFIKIKPTLYKNQGDIVGVWVNRDIDFSNVYRLIRRQK